MICECGNKLKVLDNVFNPTENEAYRKLKCFKCGIISYSCECEISYEAIKKRV